MCEKVPSAASAALLTFIIEVTGSTSDDDHVVGRLVVGKPLTTPGPAVPPLVGGAAAGGRDERCPSRRSRARERQNGHLGHGRVLSEHALDLEWVHVVTSPDEHVADVADQHEVAVVVEPAEVGVAQPPVVRERLGRARFVHQ